MSEYEYCYLEHRKYKDLLNEMAQLKSKGWEFESMSDSGFETPHFHFAYMRRKI